MRTINNTFPKYFLRSASGFLIFTAYFFLLTPNPASAQLVNLGTAKDAVQKYYDSGQYDGECKKIIDDAIEHINNMQLSGKCAVVFDIDETALSNYDLTKSIGFGYIQKMWHNSILEGKLPAVKETKRFYDYLVSKNIHVIFLTGRFAEVQEATKKNLLYSGYTKFDTLIVRSNEERKIPAAQFKEAKRKILAENGYTIIACIGDQQSDLAGTFTGYKIKLPNYLYSIE
jgi:predicted secreted acid phosphatase